METVKIQLYNFLNSCEELISCSPILAITKIGAILKSMSVCRVLVDTIQCCAQKFDFYAAQNTYIRPSPQNGDRNILTLPADRRERIAFVFCLLSAIERLDINFNSFLRSNFGDDYDQKDDEAFNAFCEKIIVPFESDILNKLEESGHVDVKEMFAETPEVNVLSAKHHEPQQVFIELLNAVIAETDVLISAEMTESDRAAGIAILQEMCTSIKREDAQNVRALLIGYNYFTTVTDADRTNTLKLLRLTEEL